MDAHVAELLQEIFLSHVVTIIEEDERNREIEKCHIAERREKLILVVSTHRKTDADEEDQASSVTKSAVLVMLPGLKQHEDSHENTCDDEFVHKLKYRLILT